jgi:protein involved in polysaccharide export with SLBB domain
MLSASVFNKVPIHMKRFVFLGTILVCAFLTGCGGSGSYAPSSSGPAAVPNSTVTDVMRVGDKITIRLTGVPDDGYYNEMEIPTSGSVSVPLLTQTFPAAGQTASELAVNIADAYKSQKIYTNPQVTVLPEERYVNVGGDVRGPARVVYTPDATLMSTINACGGFTEYADRRHVRVIRGKQVFQVDCVKAAAGVVGDDPAVYPGDEIWVPRTIF